MKKLGYTEREVQLLGLVPEDGSPISSVAMREAVYGAKPPINAQPLIIARMRGIAEKVVRNNEPFRIHKTRRAGPHPVEFSRVPA